MTILPLAVFLLAALSSCDKETKTVNPNLRNHAPEILQIAFRPARIHAYEHAIVSCQARDEDRDFLKYWWTTSGGGFPSGDRVSVVSWFTPPILERQTLQVWVTDFTDTVTARVDVDLLRVSSPETLAFVNGTGIVRLRWGASPDSALEQWSGYEVYAAGQSLIDVPPDSLPSYRLTPRPISRREFVVASLTPGRRVYCHIRSRRDYLGITERSEAGLEIDTAPRMDGFGRGPLYEVASRRGAFGVHLPGGDVEPIDVTLRDRIDLYLGTADPRDANTNLYLKSPGLLAYRDGAWAEQSTTLQPTGDDWNIPIPPAGEGPVYNQLPVEVGAVYSLYTPEGHFAKIRVLEVYGIYPERRIEFQWAWQPIPDYPRY